MVPADRDVLDHDITVITTSQFEAFDVAHFNQVHAVVGVVFLAH